MIAVTDADRMAAEELRQVLAEVSGFWHLPGDDGPLCVALARHRERTELQLVQRMNRRGTRGPVMQRAAPGKDQPSPAAFDNRIGAVRSGTFGR